MTTHLLVTNDFPPKHGGIQSYLWELWRRLPPDDVAVLTTPYHGRRRNGTPRSRSASCGRREKVLLPTPSLARRIDALADEVGADLVLLDPALPLGLLGPRLRHPLRPRAARRRGHGAGPPARHALRAATRAARRRGRSSAPAATRSPRHERAARPSAAGRERASGRRRRTLPSARRPASAPRRANGSGSRPTTSWCSASAGSSPARASTRCCAPPAGSQATAAPSWSPSAGGGRDRDRLERVARDAGAPARFLGRVDDDCCRRCTAPPTCSPCCAAIDGSASSRRGSASCSSRPRRQVSRSWRAPAGVRPRRSSTASPGRVVDPPDDVDAVARALGSLLDDATARTGMGERRGSAPSRSSPTTCSSPAFEPRSRACEDDGVKARSRGGARGRTHRRGHHQRLVCRNRRLRRVGARRHDPPRHVRDPDRGRSPACCSCSAASRSCGPTRSRCRAAAPTSSASAASTSWRGRRRRSCAFRLRLSLAIEVRRRDRVVVDPAVHADGVRVPRADVRARDVGSVGRPLRHVRTP